MDNTYGNYWEAKTFQEFELESYFDDPLLGCNASSFEDPISSYYDSSSPGGAQSILASKNILSERNRRKKLNERLYALRSVVPNITKMDKASIIKDAIAYIRSLQDEEMKIQSEIKELESGSVPNVGMFESDQEERIMTGYCCKPKRTRVELCSDTAEPTSVSSPIEVLELRVSKIGDETIVVSLSCTKRRDTAVKICEMFESLNLKIIAANITDRSGKLLKTVFLQGDEEEKEVLRLKIEAAIAALNDPERVI